MHRELNAKAPEPAAANATVQQRVFNACVRTYVVLDVFSRDVVGYMVAPHESAALATQMLATCGTRQGIPRGQLASMRTAGRR